MRATIVLLLLITRFDLLAQNKMVRIKAGEDALAVLRKEIYLYPAFIGGFVFFRDGTVNPGRLNYNTLVSEMHFLNDRGDTLALANEKTLKFVTVGADTFFYDNYYLREIATSTSIKLLSRQYLKVVDKQKIGGYDQPTSNSSISTYSSFTNGLMRYNINVKEDILMNRETVYYFGDRFNRFVPATKRNLLRMFAKNSTVAESLISRLNTDFTREKDLVNLVNSLPKP